MLLVLEGAGEGVKICMLFVRECFGNKNKRGRLRGQPQLSLAGCRESGAHAHSRSEPGNAVLPSADFACVFIYSKCASVCVYICRREHAHEAL